MDDNRVGEFVPSPEEPPQNVIPIASYATRDEILAMDDIVTVDVVIPEWNDKIVRVRGLTGKQRDAYELELVEQRGKNRQVNLQNLRAKLIAKSVVDGDGKLLFSQVDVEKLGSKNAAALQRIFKVAQDLSGLAPDDVEELTKELGEDPSADSGSD